MQTVAVPVECDVVRSVRCRVRRVGNAERRGGEPKCTHDRKSASNLHGKCLSVSVQAVGNGLPRGSGVPAPSRGAATSALASARRTGFEEFAFSCAN